MVVKSKVCDVVLPITPLGGGDAIHLKTHRRKTTLLKQRSKKKVTLQRFMFSANVISLQFISHRQDVVGGIYETLNRINNMNI